LLEVPVTTLLIVAVVLRSTIHWLIVLVVLNVVTPRVALPPVV